MSRLRVYIPGFFLLCVAILTGSCNLWRPEVAPKDQGGSESATQSIPFLTKEPETYQARFRFTGFPGPDSVHREYRFARKGGNYLLAVSPGTDRERSILRNADGQFLLEPAAGTYEKFADRAAASELAEMFATVWLNERIERDFEKLETQNGVTKYRVLLAESPNSETVIFYDEEKKLPVRQETYSGTGKEKKLVFTLEMDEFSTDLDDALFTIPDGLREKGR